MNKKWNSKIKINVGSQSPFNALAVGLNSASDTTEGEFIINLKYNAFSTKKNFYCSATNFAFRILVFFKIKDEIPNVEVMIGLNGEDKPRYSCAYRLSKRSVNKLRENKVSIFWDQWSISRVTFNDGELNELVI
jgi:hypothetical protein